LTSARSRATSLTLLTFTPMN